MGGAFFLGGVMAAGVGEEILSCRRTGRRLAPTTPPAVEVDRGSGGGWLRLRARHWPREPAGHRRGLNHPNLVRLAARQQAQGVDKAALVH